MLPSAVFSLDDMENEIIAKIQNHLSNPVDSECAVVYLLAEVRKIVDKGS